MDPESNAIRQENHELATALMRTRDVLERVKEEKESILAMHEDFKQQYDQLKGELVSTKKKFVEAVNLKKEQQMTYESEFKHLKHLMEQRQSEIDDLQRKVFAPLDTDMLRIKLMKELEGPH